MAEIERTLGGRIGVSILDCASGKRVDYRGDERFPLCSTHKALAVAGVLARVDRGEEHLDRRIAYAKEQLVTYSPVTEKHVADGMTVAALCEAAITLSDNTAANLLLDSIGGPAGFTSYVRSLGDRTTRLDRIETELNEATPGDPRDTTTPAAMADDLRKTVLGNALTPSSREQLTAWLVANTTGDKQLRAGVPPGWRVGDKTGSGEHASTNDVAILWPPSRAPLIVAAYLTESHASVEDRHAALAQVGRWAASF